MREYWDLFGIAWLTLIAASIPLSLLGILVVSRGQAILAIAASQSAACGAACSMALIGLLGLGHVHGDFRIHLGAICGGLLGTAIAWSGSSERAAWLFAAAGAGTILFISHSPYGMHDVLALQHSNAMTATINNAVLFFIVLIALVACVLRWHVTLRLLAIDPAHAKACGIHTRRWDLCIGFVIGLVLSLAVSVFGLLYAFSCLILPAIVSAGLIGSFGSLLWLAPLIAVLTTVAGIALGHVYDFPPGQSISGLLAMLFPITSLFGLYRLRLKGSSD